MCSHHGFLYAQNIDDHPAVEILHDLETITYYVDENMSYWMAQVARDIIHAILRWADMLNCRLKVRLYTLVSLF